MKLLMWCLLVAAAGCGLNTVKVAPVTVEPIRMTIDINVHDAVTPPRH
jgi:hypothetical protein